MLTHKLFLREKYDAFWKSKIFLASAKTFYVHINIQKNMKNYFFFFKIIAEIFADENTYIMSI